ncbi:MAG: hypothetical protein CMH26_03380 [Micavibrio sp.]|nr:hypothetical protein [Micavibrio sp.]|tara:strand:- start:420 stop:824 length:405 start_codon:yes stop_codon:yes gene_type:complete
MSDNEETKDKKSVKDAFSSGKPKAGGRGMAVLFTEDEMDIYCEKLSKETYIFHGKEIEYKQLDYLIYDPDKYTVDVHFKDGRVLDLGVKIQWMIRPYFSKAEEVQIVRTKNGEAIDGTFVPMHHKGWDKNKEKN